MKTITINRTELEDGMNTINKIISDILASDLDANKITINCKTRNWQGHTCPEWIANVDGVKIIVQGFIDPYQLDLDPWCYDMTINYFIAE